MKRKHERLHLEVKLANSDKVCMAENRRGTQSKEKASRIHTRGSNSNTLNQTM